MSNITTIGSDARRRGAPYRYTASHVTSYALLVAWSRYSHRSVRLSASDADKRYRRVFYCEGEEEGVMLLNVRDMRSFEATRVEVLREPKLVSATSW